MKTNCLICLKSFEYKSSQQQGLYCSHTCRAQSIRKSTYAKFLKGEVHNRVTIYSCLLYRDSAVCATPNCDVSSEWCGKPIRLQVDHTDGDPSNDSPENLRLLCPNCHSQTLSFGARNKGKGRGSRGMRLH